MDNSNLFLDSKAVAAILMVSKRTLQNYRSEGKLVFYKISPKTIRYRVEAVSYTHLRDHETRGNLV